ncbi:uncharacterized protein LOC142588373 [Dermacentor variabilis]|uniref:uncharacterized protein LOC142588373 n=1 Tax=Dermacentor variabilis TaxID=34621 RepID=UPI003F5AEC94
MCLSWPHAGPAGGAATRVPRNVTKLKEQEFKNYTGFVSLGIVLGSTQNTYFDVLQKVESITTYVGTDTLVWATLAVSESNCSTATPFVVGTCIANKPSRKCTMAIYVGTLGVHLSTQYYQCT